MRGFADLCASLRATRKTSEKTRLVGEYLASLDEESLPIAARFLTGASFAAKDERTLSVGWATLHRAAEAMFPELDGETLGDCYRAVGEMGEAVGLLQIGRGRDAAPALVDVEALLLRLSELRKADEKTRVLLDALLPLDPLVLKETVKLLVGSQRIGLSLLLVEQAVAKAFGAPLEDVKRANLLSGDVGDVALRARRRELSGAVLRLFHPMGFQLASAYEAGGSVAAEDGPGAPAKRDELDWPRLVVEEKFDGVRCQAHVEPASESSMGRVALFSRSLDEMTRAFPEIAARLARLPVSLVADGEVLAFENGRALPFGQLQKRLGRKVVDAALTAQVPLVFVFYDLLAFGGDLVIDRPFSERRKLLESLEPLPEGTLLSRFYRVRSAAELEEVFDRAIQNGNEGLVLKDETAPYAPGKRGRAWLKYKKARATLDVVVTAVEPGHGRRAGLLSDVTFAVKGPEGQLLNVGKAYSGLSDQEIEETTRLFKRITEKSFGRVRLVKPEVVLEVAFDGIQKSARHKSGFALRFPRILRLRTDKPASDIDTLERVAQLHAQLMGEIRGES
jgi:DNA ligase-1